MKANYLDSRAKRRLKIRLGLKVSFCLAKSQGFGTAMLLDGESRVDVQENFLLARMNAQG